MALQMTTAWLNAILDHGGTLITHVSLHDDFPGATGTNELSGGSYARQSITWNSASAGNLDSSNTPTVPTPAASSVAWIGFWNASTAGTFRGYAPAGGTPKIGLSVDTATDVFTLLSHGWSDDQTIVFFGGTIPGGLTEGTIYYVINSATDTFKVSATQGGGAIDITSANDEYCKVSDIAVETYTNAGQYQVSDADISAVL